MHNPSVITLHSFSTNQDKQNQVGETGQKNRIIELTSNYVPNPNEYTIEHVSFNKSSVNTQTINSVDFSQETKVPAIQATSSLNACSELAIAPNELYEINTEKQLLVWSYKLNEELSKISTTQNEREKCRQLVQELQFCQPIRFHHETLPLLYSRDFINKLNIKWDNQPCLNMIIPFLLMAISVFLNEKAHVPCTLRNDIHCVFCVGAHSQLPALAKNISNMFAEFEATTNYKLIAENATTNYYNKLVADCQKSVEKNQKNTLDLELLMNIAANTKLSPKDQLLLSQRKIGETDFFRNYLWQLASEHYGITENLLIEPKELPLDLQKRIQCSDKFPLKFFSSSKPGFTITIVDKVKFLKYLTASDCKKLSFVEQLYIFWEPESCSENLYLPNITMDLQSRLDKFKLHQTASDIPFPFKTAEANHVTWKKSQENWLSKAEAQRNYSVRDLLLNMPAIEINLAAALSFLTNSNIEYSDLVLTETIKTYTQYLEDQNTYFRSPEGFFSQYIGSKVLNYLKNHMDSNIPHPIKAVMEFVKITRTDMDIVLDFLQKKNFLQQLPFPYKPTLLIPSPYLKTWSI